MTRTYPRSVVMMALIGLAGCNGAESPTDTVEPVATTMTLSSATLAFSSLGETEQLTAQVADQTGATMNGAAVAWASSDPSVVSVTATGLVTATANGEAEITATSGSAAQSAPVTVQQSADSITLSGSAVVLAGPLDTMTVTATVLDARGSEVTTPDLVWLSDNELVVTVSSSGVMTAVARGSATVTVQATSGGQTATQVLSVTVDDAVRVEPTGGSISLASDAVTLLFPAGAVSVPVFITAVPAVGLPTQPEAILGTAFDFKPDGTVFATPVTLTIGYDPVNVPQGVPEEDLRLHELIGGEYVQVATSTVDVGTGTVTGAIDGFSVFVILPVQRRPASMTLTPPSVELVRPGDAVTVTASVLDAGGSQIASPVMTWTSNDEGVATVSSAGLVTAIAAGTTTINISARSAGLTLTKALAVTVQQVPVSMTLSPSPLVLAGPGDATTVTASVLDGGGSPIASPAMTWSSDDNAIVTVTADGLVTAVASGVATITVGATSGGLTVIEQLSVTVNVTLAVTTASLPNGAPGVGYNGTLTATGGDGTNTWAVTIGLLPSGLVLNPTTGVISGTPTGSRTTFTVEVTSGDGQTAARTLAIDVNAAPTVTTLSLPNGAPTVFYNETLTATGGDGTYSWAVTVGTLPAGLALNATTGTISGTPTASGISFTVQVTSGDTQTAQRALTITVNPTLAITTTSLSTAAPGVGYNQTLTATGGDGSYTWAVSIGSLPTGLVLNPTTGVISGAPTGSGTMFTIETTSGDAQTDSQALTIGVAASLGVVTTALPNGAPTVAYNQTLAAVGGDGSYTWALTIGALPAGLVLNTAGEISGTPTASGTTFTIEVTSGDAQTAQRQLTINVNATLTIATTTLPNGALTVAYSQSLVATGGNGATTWALAGGSGPLPTGLLLSADGSISGTPTGSTTTFTVQATNVDGQTAIQILSITISATVAISTTSLPDAAPTVSYDETLTATGGDLTYSWAVTAGALPAGLALNPTTGTISGTPTGTTATFTVRVTSGDLQTAQQVLTIAVNPVLAVTTTSLSAAAPGVGYNETLTATGGDGSYTWAVSIGSLPTGLVLNPTTGAISGTPTGSSATFTVEVTSGDAQTDLQVLTVAVNPTVAVTTTSLPNGAPTVAYIQTLAATGGDGSYTWALTIGSLPAGLVLNTTTGVISGTPTASGTTFTIEVTSGDAQTAQQQLTITVNPALAVTTTSLADGAPSVPYSETVTASGGDGTYTWAVTSGSLPTGLALASSGAISGMPTIAGTSNFMVEVTAGDAQTALQILSIRVQPPILQPSDLCSENLAGSIASFADANLEAGVRTALGVGAQDDLTCQLISGLTSLSVGSASIVTLSGVQNLTGLTQLALPINSISDISALSGLTSLTSLNLGFNLITNISALSGLTSLTFLDLFNNTITDITAISSLTSLTSLRLRNNPQVEDLSALSGLPNLTSLFFEDTRVSDISALSGITTLTELHLENSQVSDISALIGLTNLTLLHIASNAISDLSSLSGLTSLTVLHAGNNAIIDVSALTGLTSLVDLFLNSNSIVDISGLGGLTSLESLRLHNNPISNIQSLIANTGLGTGDAVNLSGVDPAMPCADVALLQAKGVGVLFDVCS